MFHGSGMAWWAFARSDEEKQPRVTRDLLRRVAAYARPYAFKIALALVAILAATMLALIPPLLFRELIDHALPQKDFMRLNLLAGAMIALPLLEGLIDLGQRWLTARVGEGIIADLRKSLYAHLQKMSLRFFTNTKTGELMSRLNNDVIGAQRAVTNTLLTIITSAFQAILTLGIMLSLEWRLSLLALVALPFLILPSRRVGRILRGIINQQLDLIGQMNTMINETVNVSGALLVKLFGRQRDEVARFGERADRVAAIGVKQTLAGRWFFLLLGFIAASGVAVVWWIGGVLVLRDEITIGTIVAFAAYLTKLYQPVAGLINARVDFATSMVSFERVFALLDLPVEIQDRPDACVLTRARGDIRFENVSFAYLDSNAPSDLESPIPHLQNNGHDKHESSPIVPTRRWAVRDANFQIQAGQLAALVGPSGAGKTTITYLIPRLYDPTEGRVLIDGYDARAITGESLSRQIGMVTQETYLFHDTIRMNLLYAKPDATPDELDRAARAANIYDFISKLPHGYDTIVGERGYRLSGGEKQRVAIARVILKDPRILVLDEATSSLDSESEALIQSALAPLMRGRTSVVIAHRLSTILSADVILVVDDGAIVEQGTHAELLARAGLYARLYRTQFREQFAVISEPYAVANKI